MTNNTLESDLQYINALLHRDYTITWGDNRKSPADKITHEYFRCRSEKGFVIPYSDKEDSENWELFVKYVKEHFGKRFMEIYHNTCFLHKDFVIYFRPKNYRP